jgi:hypothetical protein
VQSRVSVKKKKRDGEAISAGKRSVVAYLPPPIRIALAQTKASFVKGGLNWDGTREPSDY